MADALSQNVPMSVVSHAFPIQYFFSHLEFDTEQHKHEIRGNVMINYFNFRTLVFQLQVIILTLTFSDRDLNHTFFLAALTIFQLILDVIYQCYVCYQLYWSSRLRIFFYRTTNLYCAYMNILTAFSNFT